jgi:hypothetical protein
MAISASNFQSNSLSGTVTISNGFANILLPTIPYALEGNKTFVIKLRSGSINGTVLATSPTFTLQDTSSFVSLTANTATVNEGSSVTFTLTMANTANGTNLYYSLGGGTNNQDWTSANAGIVTINNNVGTFTLTANADSLSEGAETYQIQLRTNSVTGNIVYNSTSYTLADTSNAEITASGGNDTFTFAGYKYHVFLSSNNFVVSSPSSNITVDYMLIAGGGGGAVGYNPNGLPGSGGGAGGLLMGNISISGTSSIIVGAGGSAAPARNINGGQGVNTSIFSAVAFGGGGGAYTTGYLQFGNPGGSGSGAGINNPNGASGGLAIGSPAVDVAGAQGYPGGSIFGSNPTGISSSGGGGAGGAGLSFTGANDGPRDGGIGLVPPWLGIPSSYGTPGPGPGRYFAGGGGGSTGQNTSRKGDGGAGGGGRGARSDPNQAIPSTNANAYTGGGGGGGASPTFLGGAGGSGIAIIRYPIVLPSTTSVDYLLVAGGGGGGAYGAGGGGGGVLTALGYSVTPGSPITVTVGAGGAGGTAGSANPGTQGNSSVFGSITATGGGYGAYGSGVLAGGNGGSGGGGGTNSGAAGKGIYPGSPYVSSTRQGYDGGTGGTSGNYHNGGGGGAGGAGTAGGDGPAGTTGDGGIGLLSNITGSSVYYAGGGGGGGAVGNGVGGNGGGGTSTNSSPGQSGTTNTGGGGAGGSYNAGTLSGGSGGSGVVILRYPGAYKPATVTGSNVTYTSDGSNLIYTFYSSGTITF